MLAISCGYRLPGTGRHNLVPHAYLIPDNALAPASVLAGPNTPTQTSIYSFRFISPF